MSANMQGSSDEQTASAMTSMTTTSQYCPRHHHHTQQQQQQQQQRQTPSPNKRHRLTPRPHNIQRPCLDFEKMQQVRYFNIVWASVKFMSQDDLNIFGSKTKKFCVLMIMTGYIYLEEPKVRQGMPKYQFISVK